MKKLSKKQKTILLIGIITLIVFGFRPILEHIEMTKVNVDNQTTSKNVRIYAQALTDIEIHGLKTYANYDENYRAKKGQIRLLFFKDGQLWRDQFKKQCFTKEQFRVLSTQTQDDQLLFKKYFDETESTSTIRFMDLNRDNVDDLLMVQGSQDNFDSINFYSAQENHVLWQISDFIHDDFYRPSMHVKILNQSEQPATIVVYQPEYSNKYFFYKSINKKYQVIQPTGEDWKSYWSGVSTLELAGRGVGFLFVLLSIFVLSVLTSIILLILGIKTIIKKLKVKDKKTISD